MLCNYISAHEQAGKNTLSFFPCSKSFHRNEMEMKVCLKHNTVGCADHIRQYIYILSDVSVSLMPFDTFFSKICLFNSKWRYALFINACAGCNLLIKGGAIKVTFVTLGLINRINASAGSNLLRHVDDTGVQIRKIAIVTLFSPCFHYIIDVLYLLLYCGIFILYGAAIITRSTNFSYQNL